MGHQPNRSRERIMRIVASWIKKNASGICIALATGALVSWATYIAGLDNGHAEGLALGRIEGAKAAIGDLAEHAKKSREGIDASVLKSEVERMCGERLGASDRECALQASAQRTQGFEAGRSAGRQSCSIEGTYSVFREKVTAGAEAANKGSRAKLLESARQVVRINESAGVSFIRLSREAFDGPAVTELADALRRDDVGKVTQIMKDLAGTLKARDVVVNDELRRLEEARLK
jgi:hypothetical protein